LRDSAARSSNEPSGSAIADQGGRQVVDSTNGFPTSYDLNGNDCHLVNNN